MLKMRLILFFFREILLKMIFLFIFAKQKSELWL